MAYNFDEIYGEEPAQPSTAPAVPAARLADGGYDFDSIYGAEPATATPQAAVQASIYDASFGNPDEAAQRKQVARDLEKFLGDTTPASVIDITDAQRRLRVAEADHATRASPRTSAWLSNAENAAIAADDAKTLAQLEGLTSTLGGMARGVAKGATYDASAAIAGVALAPLELGEQGLRALGLPEWAAKSHLADVLRDSIRSAQKVGATFNVPGGETTVERGLFSGAQSLGQNLAVLPAGMAARSGELATRIMALMSGGSSYVEARAEGAAPLTALSLAAPDAVAEYATEKFGMKALFDQPAFKSAFLKQAAKFATLEMGGEQVATVWQDFNRWMVLNPGKTLDDFIAERPEAAAQTAIATLVGAGGQIALVRGIDAVFTKESEGAQVEAGAQTLQELFAAAEQSLTRGRDTQTFDAFFQDVAGDATVFVDPVVLRQAAEQAGIDETRLPSLTEQSAEAANVGAGVEIPVAELVSAFTGTGIEQQIIENTRMAPDAATLAEVRADGTKAMEFFQAEAAKALEQATQQEEFRTAAETVKADVLAEIKAAAPERITTPQQEGYASLVGSFYSTIASRMGITPRQLRDGWTDAAGVQHRGYRLGVLNEQMRAARATGQQFDQTGKLVTDTPAFKEWFGDSKVVDAEGKPRVVYHGTQEDFSAFRKEGVKTLGFPDKQGFYFTPDADYAQDYGGALMPVYLSLKNPYRAARDGFEHTYISPARRAELEAQGYDGVIFEGDEKGLYRPEIIAFDPAQIKSVFNRGTFSRTDPNILLQSANDFLTAFDAADTIELVAPTTSEEEIDRAQDEFLSHFPKTGRYPRDTRLLARIRRASEKALDALDGSPETDREVASTLGPFSAYNVGAEVLEGDSLNPNGSLRVTIFGKEQVEAGLTDEPALTITVTADGELTLNGPSPNTATFEEFKARGWADYARGADGAVQTGWSALKDPANPDKPLPITQILPLLADTHARVREWRGEDYVGMHWTRATGALGGLFDQDESAVFFQEQAKDLIVQHNLTAANLLHAQKMGGIPVPSLAITKKDAPLAGFGEITLLGSREMADPKGYAGTKVFGADIYSPRYPSITYDFTANMRKRAEAQLKPGMDATETRYVDWSEIEKGPRELERTAPFMWKFLKDNGIEPTIVRTQPKPLPAALQPFAEAEKFDPFDAARDPAFAEIAYQAWEDQFVEANGEAEREDAKARVAEMRARGEERGVDYLVRDAARQVNQYRMDRAASGKVDGQATRNAMEGQIRAADLTNKLESSAVEFFESVNPNERIFRGFTPSGNRKYVPHTLENVVKILKTELRGGENFNYGVGSLRAKFTPQFKSIEQIRKAKDRLLGKAEFEKVKNEIDDEFWASAAAINKDLSSETALAIFEDSAKMGVVRAAKAYGFEVNEDAAEQVAEFLTRLRNLPTEYFEAKILRDVDLAEFSGAVVPEGADQKVIDALQARGVKDIRFYKKGDEADRAAKIGQFENLFFQQAQAQRGAFSPRTLDISFLANADASTFLHETGHFFLTVYADLASQPDAPAEIKADMGALLKWFDGGRTLDEWNALSLDQQRPYHEQFAETFEEYLFTGKAPTKELQPLFRRFAKWLTSVYGSIRDFVARNKGAKLNEEVSAIFDRMIATDAEIEAMRAARAYTQLFRNAAEAGMNPADFAAYQALDPESIFEAEEQLRTRGLRDMKWLQNRRNKVIAELQEETKARRAEVRAEVEKEVAERPLYRAMRFLKRGETTAPDGAEIKAEAGHKLRIADVEAIFPTAEGVDLRKLGYGRYGMLAEEGLPPDMVAEIFGFTSGETLVRQLLDAPKFRDEVEGLTDQRMLEQYGDLSSPQDIERAADEAIHNDARTRMVATELHFLGKSIGKPGVLIKAAREYARQIVETKSLKTLKPANFAAEETRAGKSAMEALRKGDREEAARLKRTELLNHAAAKEAYAAAKEMEKIVNRLKKIADTKDEAAARSREMDMVNATRAILAEFGIGRHGEKAAAYLKTVEALDPDMSAALDDIIGEAAANARDYRTLPLRELRELGGMVDAIWSMAKTAKQVQVEGKRLQLDDVRRELTDKLLETAKAPTRPKGLNLTKAETAKVKFARLATQMKRPEAWVGMKDGADTFGPWRRYIWKTINDAQTALTQEKAARLKQMKDLVRPVLQDMVPQRIEAPEIGVTFGASDTLGYSELLHALLHTGNESNKRKLLLGRGWATERADGSLDTSKWDALIARLHSEGKLAKRHWDFVQSVWDFMEDLKPGAQRAHKEAFGRYFDEVTAATIDTPFGQYKGGYVPARPDRLQVADADLKAMTEAGWNSMLKAFPTSRRGFTKGRVEYNVVLELNLQSLTRHVDEVLTFTHMNGPVRDVQRILKGGELSSALAVQDREAINYLILPWLQHAAQQTVTLQGNQNWENWKIWSKLRSRTGAAIMFANLKNVTQQLTSFFPALLKVKPTYLLHAAATNVLAPRDLAKHVSAMSPYMNQRINDETYALASEIDEILLNPTKLESAQQWSMKHAYFMQMAVDNWMGPTIWLAKYNETMESAPVGMPDAEITAHERKAIELADSAVRMTQGAMRPIDVAAFEGGSPFARMFTQFAGFFSTQINMMGEQAVIAQQMPDVKKKYARLGMIAFLGWYAPAIASEIISMLFAGGPPDEDKDGEYLDDWLRQILVSGPVKYATAMVPIAGQGIQAVVNAFNDKPYDDRLGNAPAVGALESAGKAAGAAYKLATDPDYDPKPGPVIRDTGMLLSILTGLPVLPAAKSIGYLTDVESGRVSPTSPADLVRGTITGVASPESK